MRKLIILNAGPRKNFNTAQLLKEAQKGAESIGVDVEYIDLFDIDFKGCRSCYACKIKGSKTKGLCAINDNLRPILEKILKSNAVIIGTPIYCGDTTGVYRNLTERMIFAAIKYLKDETTGVMQRELNCNIPIGIINTMGATEEQFNRTYLPEMIGMNEFLMKTAFGYCEVLNIFDTPHFDDYSKYECNIFDAEHKKQVKETQFPKDLKRAFEFGKKLSALNI